MNDQNDKKESQPDFAQDSSKDKILVFPNPTLKPDVYLALQTLATAYQDKGQVVEVAIAQPIPTSYTSLLPLENVKTITEIPPQKFLIQFPKQESTIKGIQWNQNQDSVNFYISMEKGKFIAENMKFQALGAEYAQIILLGVNSVSELGDLYTPESQYIFESSKTTSIGGQLKNNIPDLKTEIDHKNTSILEDVYTYMKNASLPTNSLRAQNILTGILLTTNNFQLNINDAKTFITCAELLKAGATTSEASKLAQALQKAGGQESAPEDKK